MISPIPPRRSSRRALAAAVGALAVLTSLAWPPGLAVADVPEGTGAARPAADAGPGQHTVTLLTGDVVRVTDAGDGRQTADVTRPSGATGGVRTETVDGDLYVYPDEVLPYLAANRLDKRLFDVTSLIEQGYDDAHSTGIPLILGYGARTAAADRTAPAGTTRVRSLPAIRATSVRAAKKSARKLWKSVAPATASAAPRLGDGLSKIWLDGKVKAALADTTAQIGAATAWQKGYDGKGVKVAVLDTGADLDHPDLAGRIGGTRSFVPGEAVQDGHGHGTHTASTVGGSGAASDGAEKGVAPGADLLIGKVLADSGYGDESWIIAGMDWAADQGAKVVSMSLGTSTPSDGTDVISQAVNRLTDETGALFVIAAGNSGAESTIGSPGAADKALTVAAVDSADKRASFSSQGPRYGDYGLKPDISAPGVNVLAAKAGGSAATGWYQKMSGTSMATPHVAGAAAILAQEHPDWKAQELKDALMSTSEELPAYTTHQVGSGRADLAAATAATVTATGSVDFGIDSWPHADSKAVDRTVTYRNSGDEPAELHLSLNAAVTGGPVDTNPTADKGKPAPEGMFTLSADTVTVPAHGTATVTATARPGLGADGRRYLGQITATDGSGAAPVRTRFGLYREDARHDLHVTLKDRSGKPAAGWVEIQRLGSTEDPYNAVIDDSGTVDLRLREGTYSLLTYQDVAGSHGPDSVGMALMGDPEVVLDQDRDVSLDASRTREVTAEVPRRTEDRALSMNWYRADGQAANSYGVGVVEIQYLLNSYYDSMFVLPTRKATQGTFEYETRWRKALPLLTVTDDGKPVRVIGQARTALYDGRKRLEAVYAGTGTPAEYAGLNVKGKVALVTRADALTGAQRAQAAADAGAALLLVVNDKPGKLIESVGTSAADSTVPVFSLTARDGAPLIADARRGRLRLDVEGVPDSPYVYDLSDPHPGQIPSTGLTYRPRASELATVEMRFHAATTTPSGEWRSGYRPYRKYGSGFLQRLDMPGTRTDYVSAQEGTAWIETSGTGPGVLLSSQGPRTAYKPGSWQVRNWFKPVTRPANGGTYWWSQRQKTSLAFNVQPWSDSGDGHGGVIQSNGPAKVSLKVYQDGTLLKTSNTSAANFTNPPAVPSVYTLDMTAERDADTYRLSPRTHTVWQVRSDPVTDPTVIDRVAVLQMDYDVVTDLAGDARGGRQTLRLTPRHLDGAAGAGKIQGAALSVSFDDGATWKPVRTTGKSGTWTARYLAPHHGYVSLKAEGWDDAGNRIDQEVIRAYGLR
ncbi:S8 family peptidase [Streptomyces triticiradicis]|uniref:S8 family serine peptidase n=1 Tax=Streptomyces triticiradicis TaxID=2651189 RepID=A0A7J5DPH0_9ACTN|nr:S8 family serine peptidase [Streptomyces triticiradicis]KAB1990687.1 S8 family serine peptidase [Streptomyces triticiradicis]